MQNALLLLRDMADRLQPAERQVAEYVLTHPNEVFQMSVHSLAEKTSTSVATVTRLTQKLGFQGYQQMKLSLAAHAGSTAPSFPRKYEDIQADMTISDIVNQATQWARKCLEETALILVPDEIEKAIHALLKTRKLFFYGVGSSSFVALDAANKWLRLDYWSAAYSDLQLMVTSSSLLRPGDTAVCISYSGETKETLQAAQTAKENGAAVISITQASPNPLSQMADIRLWVSATEYGMKRGDIGSRLTMSHVIDILYMAVVSRSLEKSVPHPLQ
jgi:DNA-binding MurR/RpiR family transcriptional regulator